MLCDHDEPCDCYGRQVPRGDPPLKKRPHMSARHHAKPKAAHRVGPAEWREMSLTCLMRPSFGGGTIGPCERCGKRLATDAHHRLPRGEGGPDCLSNLAALCRECHDWAHNHPFEARPGGWMILPEQNFQVRGMFLWTGQLVVPDDDGGYSWAQSSE